MKLDKIKFARLVSYFSTIARRDFDEHEIAQLDSFINIDVDSQRDAPPVHHASKDDVNAMIAAMASGKKIEAIKYHRAMTGAFLKESKDIIETVMNKPEEPSRVKADMIAKLDKELANYPEMDVSFILYDFTDEKLRAIREFIKSFY